MNKCFFGDCREILKQLIDDGVKAKMCVTSPPYWNLRDYGVEGQIGMERTVEEYVFSMVKVFRLVRELLVDDGTLWLNIGDSYSHGGCGGRDPKRWPKQSRNDHVPTHAKTNTGLKPKDLLMIPARVAMALQSEGWYLRSDIIWHKSNPMPESVKDRPTKSHEYLFLLSKSARYYYDYEAIKEPVNGTAHSRGKGTNPKSKDSGVGWNRLSRMAPGDERNNRCRHKQNESFSTAVTGLVEKRNKRSVWSVHTEPYPEAHFATFPKKLIEPCILAGSRPGDIVLDPFFGSGTTGEVAQYLGRQWVGIELNPEYGDLQLKRTQQAGMVL